MIENFGPSGLSGDWFANLSLGLTPDQKKLLEDLRDSLSETDVRSRAARWLRRSPADQSCTDIWNRYLMALWKAASGKSPGPPNPDAVKPWCITVVHNLIKDRLKSKYEKWLRVPKVQLDDANPAAPAGTGLSKSDADNLWELVGKSLPPNQARMIILRYRDGLSGPEIAREMGCPLGTVKGGLHKALKKLRESGVLQEFNDVQ